MRGREFTVAADVGELLDEHGPGVYTVTLLAALEGWGERDIYPDRSIFRVPPSGRAQRLRSGNERSAMNSTKNARSQPAETCARCSRRGRTSFPQAPGVRPDRRDAGQQDPPCSQSQVAGDGSDLTPALLITAEAAMENRRRLSLCASGVTNTEGQNE